MSELRTRWSILAFLLCILFLPGCSPRPDPIYPKYVPRETQNGVYIFEYEPGNQASSKDGDSLSLFMDSLNAFMKKNPDLTIIRTEPIQTTVTRSNSGGQGTSAVSVVHVIVYTQAKGKP